MRFLSFHCDYFRFKATKRSRSKIFEELTEEKVIIEEDSEADLEEDTRADIEEDIEVNIEKEYISAIVVISLALSDSLEKYGQSTLDFAEGKISISEHKVITKKHIEEIKTLYDMHLELKPSKRLEKSNDLYCKAMDHIFKSTIYLQSYIDTNDDKKMAGYLGQTTNELNLYKEYILKATEQMKKLTE